MSTGPAFTQHFHFGADTLTELLLHSTSTCNTPTLASALLLLTGATDPGKPSSLLVPMLAVARLAAAAVGVLPDEGRAAGAAAAYHQQQQQGMELQPSPELQTAYEAACRYPDRATKPDWLCRCAIFVLCCNASCS